MTAIYFDLDGTLTDPKLGITRSIRYALNKLGLAAPSEDDLIWCIGPPLLPSLARLVGDDKLAARALSLYRERYAEIGLFENALYAGVQDALAELAKSGRRLFVATSKPTTYAERIINHFGLTAYFEEVFGSELNGERSDKTELLSHALQATRSDPQRTIMVGDRSHDMIGARNNGMIGVGVLYGYGSREELAAAGAKYLCAAPRNWLEHAD